MNKNKKIVKILGIAVCGALVASGSMMYAHYKNSAEAYQETDKDIKEAKAGIEKAYPVLLKSNGGDKDKVETAYAIMDSDGNLNNVIVSERLANINNEKEIKDFSDLKNIENTSGNEKFLKDGKNIKWQADGKRIDYRGEGKKDLPVSVKVSYYLNGEKKTADEIAGKEGDVKIRFDYDVLKKDFVNGKYYKHPYTMASGLTLNNEHFSDVNVSNGKTVDNGNNTLAFGIGFPSMNENLGVSRLDINIPSYVEVSAYTDNFSIPATYTIAFSSDLNDFDTGKVDNAGDTLDQLEAGLNKLSSASKKLLAGSDVLADGASKLNRGVKGFVNGTDRLYYGSDKLLSGADELYKGLSTLSRNSAKINSGVSKLETSVFATATNQLRQETGDNKITLNPKTYIKVIQGISDGAINAAEQALREALKANGVTDRNLQDQLLSVAYNILMSQGKTEATKEEITDAVNQAGIIGQKANFVSKAIEKNKEAAIQILTEEGYTQDQITDSDIAVVSTALELGGGDPANIPSKMEEAKEYVKSAGLFQNGAIDASDNVKKLAAMAVGKKTPERLAELKNSLDNVESLLSGIRAYTCGVDLSAVGSRKILAGAKELNKGALALNKGVVKLADGSEKLKNGSETLNRGLAKFDKEGIAVFVNKLNTKELKRITENMKAIKEASKREIFVGGKPDSMSGESKIIFKTGSVN